MEEMMSDRHVSRNALIALLDDFQLLYDLKIVPSGSVIGLEELSSKQKLILLSTCCADMITLSALVISNRDKNDAIEGIKSLFEDMQNNIMKDSFS
jgi:hypothetical protein